MNYLISQGVIVATTASSSSTTKVEETHVTPSSDPTVAAVAAPFAAAFKAYPKATNRTSVKRYSLAK